MKKPLRLLLCLSSLLVGLLCSAQLVDLAEGQYEADYLVSLQSVLPERFQGLLNKDPITSTQKTLYAGKYETVKELVDDLIGDVGYIQNFDLDAPFNYNYEDYEPSSTAEVEILTEQVIGNLVTKLYYVYKDLKKMCDILERMTEKDFLAVHDYIYGDDDPSNIDEYSTQGIESEIDEWDFSNFEWEGIRPEIQTDRAEVPFLESEPGDFSENIEDEVVDAQLLKLLLKIPLIILKLIAKIIWNLIALKKLIRIAEDKALLLVIRLIKIICKIITYLKREIIFKIKVFLRSITSGLIFKKILRVIFLIIKKLRVLSWILKDLLYRYKWKLIFLVKKAKKTSFIVAVYFQELVYKKLGKETKEQKMYKDFISYDDDIEGWSDYDYYKKFAYYIYQKPGTYKSTDSVLDKIVQDGLKEVEQDEADEKKYKDEGLTFDLKEEYGFDSVKLDLKKFQQKEDTSKYEGDYVHYEKKRKLL